MVVSAPLQYIGVLVEAGVVTILRAVVGTGGRVELQQPVDGHNVGCSKKKQACVQAAFATNCSNTVYDSITTTNNNYTTTTHCSSWTFTSTAVVPSTPPCPKTRLVTPKTPALSLTLPTGSTPCPPTSTVPSTTKYPPGNLQTPALSQTLPAGSTPCTPPQKPRLTTRARPR